MSCGWIRLVRLEEAQQALDIRRYDAHNGVKIRREHAHSKARSVPMGVDNRRNTMDMTDYMPFDEFDRYDVDVYSLEEFGSLEDTRPWRETMSSDCASCRSRTSRRTTKTIRFRLTPTSPRLPATVVRVLTRKSTVCVAIPPLV